MDKVNWPRRLPIGAELCERDRVHFRVWAPRCRRVEVVLPASNESAAAASRSFELEAEEGGYFSRLASGLAAGVRYGFRLDGAEEILPDPASRFQPEGCHGLSEIIDPAAFRWTDADWKGIDAQGQVVYEMHLGTFTQEGTWKAATRQLAELAELGITVLEVMPVAEFPGRFGWGYDGVDLFAPTRLYGTPDDFRSFVNEAHAVGLGVILDVVYNHVGPDGNYLKLFSEDYFSRKHATEWGEAINFDGENSAPVREFFTANARYWIEEFHLDGLRLDATQQIFDDTSEHILMRVAREARRAAAPRDIYLVAENEPQHSQYVRPAGQGGYGIDALWNDDFHHSALVALTGHNDAYYSDHLGNPQEFVSAAKWGYLYQGQYYSWQEKPRGMPALDLGPEKFVHFIQNHDQIANSGNGLRIQFLTSPGRYRAMTALLLLGPQTPMLFQGQEFAAAGPFFYFADHHAELAAMVRQGRKDFLSQFRNLAQPEVQAELADPSDPRTFERSKLKFSDRKEHAAAYRLHRDLLRLRRQDPVFRAPRRGSTDGAVLGPEIFLLRFFADDGHDRLLIVNLGRNACLCPAPEPLLAPPADTGWQVLWSSEDVRYGGSGMPPVEPDKSWQIPGEAAVALAPRVLATKESEHGSCNLG